MKKKITFLFFTLITSVIIAQTATVNGTSYSTLADAYTAATGGDIIVVDGIFDENLTSNKAVSLQGDDPATDGIVFTGTGRLLNYTSSVSGDFSISNLTISGGDATGNGAGLLVDKSTSSQITLSNLIVENNTTTANGGGISIISANVTMTNIILRNNQANNGGGIHIAVVNGVGSTSGANKLVTMSNSLIHNNNSSTNAGGLYVFAGGAAVNKNLTVNVDNTTIALNTAVNQGGSSYILGGVRSTGGPSLTVNMTHVTSARNTAASVTTANKNNFGIYFLRNAGTAAENPIFNAYNSIFVAAGAPANRGINFAWTNPPNFINNLVGGQNANSNIVNSVNNIYGRTAGQIGVAAALTDEGGFSNVLAIASGDAIDYCTSATGTSLPAVDQRNYTRDVFPNADAGAFEFGAKPLSVEDVNSFALKLYPNPASDVVFVRGVENINSIKVYSILGALEKVVVKTNQVNVSGLSAGIHVIKVDNDQGVFSSKLVIK